MSSSLIVDGPRPNEGSDTALAQADAFAQSILLRVAPLVFGVAECQADLRAVFRLRYEVVMTQGWAAPEQFPDRLERDEYDLRAIQVVGREGDELVGTTRLVPPAPGLPTPTEAAFGLQLSRHGAVVDMGRTCRAPGRTDLGPRVFWGLLSRAWLELRKRGFSEICGAFSPGISRLYERLGFEVELLGPPRMHWGESRHPVLVRPARCIDRLRFRS